MGCGQTKAAAGDANTAKQPEVKQAPAETTKPAEPEPPKPAEAPKAPEPAPPPKEEKKEPPPPKPEPEKPKEVEKPKPVQSKALPDRVQTDELSNICQTTHFDRTQVEKLYEIFKVISSSGDDDGLIDKEEFQQALGLKKNLFLDRMFQIFDDNGDANINFHEFIVGLSIFSNRASVDEKTRFSFKMYDFDGDGYISKDELRRMLQATIDENKLNITPEQADQLVEATFEEAEVENGLINFEDYKKLVAKHPSMLSNMTIQSLNSIESR